MRKPLVIVDSDPELKAIEKEMEDLAELAKKQDEEIERKKKELWVKIELRLEAKGLLPYEEDNSVSIEDGVIFHKGKRGEGNPIKELKSLFERLGAKVEVGSE